MVIRERKCIKKETQMGQESNSQTKRSQIKLKHIKQNLTYG